MHKNLEDLRTEVICCTRCHLKATRRNVVFGAGRPDAKILFLGEAPGGKEDETGLPFVGEAGVNLSNMLAELGLTRDDIFLTSPVKCRPTKPSPRPKYGQYANRKPTVAEIKACAPWMEAQIKLLQPELIVTLGDIPLKWVMGKDYKVGKCHGKVLHSEKYECNVFALFHPAAIIYDRKKEADFEMDLAALKKFFRSQIGGLHSIYGRGLFYENYPRNSIR